MGIKGRSAWFGTLKGLRRGRVMHGGLASHERISKATWAGDDGWPRVLIGETHHALVRRARPLAAPAGLWSRHQPTSAGMGKEETRAASEFSGEERNNSQGGAVTRSSLGGPYQRIVEVQREDERNITGAASL